MKTKNLSLALATIVLYTGSVIAQDNPSEELKTTTSKTYTMNMGKEVVKRTVEISTVRANTVELDEMDDGKIDQDRIVDSVATITKTVRIDNDADDAFDEKIVFSYRSDAPEDFVLVSNNKELMVALDNGENLKIIEDMSLKSKNKSKEIETYIFTDKKGQEIEFLVEEYTTSMEKS